MRPTGWTAEKRITAAGGPALTAGPAGGAERRCWRDRQAECGRSRQRQRRAPHSPVVAHSAVGQPTDDGDSQQVEGQGSRRSLLQASAAPAASAGSAAAAVCSLIDSCSAAILALHAPALSCLVACTALASVFAGRQQAGVACKAMHLDSLPTRLRQQLCRASHCQRLDAQVNRRQL